MILIIHSSIIGNEEQISSYELHIAVKDYCFGRDNRLIGVSVMQLKDIQDKAKDICLSSGMKNSDILVEKSRDTAFKIIDVAIEKDVDLIVMGASGISGFKAFMLGSISQEVLKKAACPVTIVH